MNQMDQIDDKEAQRRQRISEHRQRVGRQGGDGGSAARAERTRIADDFAKSILPHLYEASKSIRQQGGFVSNVALAEALNNKGLTTPRGCRWTAKQIERLLSRKLL
jgi:hypothetical protein